MDMLSGCLLLVVSFGRVKTEELGWHLLLGFYLEGEASELPDDHPLALEHLLLDILLETLDNDVKLGLGLHGLESLGFSRLRFDVSSGVVSWVGDDPIGVK